MVAEADSASGRTSTPATSSSMSGSAGPDMPANGRLGAMYDSGCTARVPAAGFGVADPEGVMIPEGRSRAGCPPPARPAEANPNQPRQEIPRRTRTAGGHHPGRCAAHPARLRGCGHAPGLAG